MGFKFSIFFIVFMVMAKTTDSTLDPDDPLLLHFIEEVETIKSDIQEVNALQSVNLSHVNEQFNQIVKDLERKIHMNFTLTTEIWEVLKNYSKHFPVKPASDNMSKNFKFILKALQSAFDSANLELHRFEALNEYGTQDYLKSLNKHEKQYLEGIKKKNAPTNTYYLIKEFYAQRNKTEHNLIGDLFKIEGLLISLIETTQTANKIFLAAKKKGGGEMPTENWLLDWKIVLREVVDLGTQKFSLHQNYLQSLYVDNIIINYIYKITNIIDPEIPRFHLEAALNGDKIKNENFYH